MAVRVWGLVPVKGFDRGKSRLRAALGDEQRTALARQLFEHVLAVTIGSGVLAGVLVATDSVVVAEVARSRGALVRMDAPGTNTLADVVDRGLTELRFATAALVVMADLPYLGVDDVRALVGLMDGHDVVAVRASDGLHTNALGLSPPTCLGRTAFGRGDSYAAHVAAARAAGLTVATIENPRIALDIDLPADLELKPPAA
jgi:2-phospho-L-lactate/phosphoenolpyruvate guanylyltransferase